MSGLVAVALCTGMACTGPVASEISARDVTSLVDRIETIRTREDVPAVGFALVARDRSLWTGALGTMDRETGEPADAHTTFRIGSITKAFTGIAMLLAEADGSLRLDQPVRSVLPDVRYRNQWAETHPIRLADLLEHTSGLGDLTAPEWTFSDPTVTSAAEAWRYAEEARIVQWPPGVHSTYSNVGAGLAAMMLEQATGLPLPDFVHSRILDRLDMTGAGFVLDNRLRETLASGYDTDGYRRLRYWHMIFPAFGGLNATPVDMAKFMQMWLNDGVTSNGRLLTSEQVSRAENPATTLAARAGLKYGYGLGNYQWYRDGWLFHGHGGDADGYLSHFGYQKDSGLAYFIVVTVFRHAPLRAIRSVVEDFITSTLPAASLPAQSKADPVHMNRYSGCYVRATWRFKPANAPRPRDKFEASVTPTGLHLNVGDGSERTLLHTGGGLFRYPIQPGPTIAIAPGPDGDLALQGDIGNFVRVSDCAS